MEWLIPIVGFMIAAYAIVANDALQTLGTFLASNDERPWWQMWLFAGGILAAVLIYGWWGAGGVSYGRLDKIPEPTEMSWFYVLPPIVLLVLTRYGIPVSTTFLVLTIFAQKQLDQMLIKSGMGYLVALGAALLAYLVIARIVEERFLHSAHERPPSHWVVIQWVSTAWLWSQWLVHDLANIFVFLPRELSAEMLVFGLITMLALLGYVFYSSGGAIQRIVTSKTNTQDIRSATLIDFMFGTVLFIFKEWSKIPMSTTWVFLGLLAGRELALTIRLAPRPLGETVALVASDAGKALGGLAISVLLAVGLPWVAAQLGEETEVEPPPAMVGEPDAPSNI